MHKQFWTADKIIPNSKWGPQNGNSNVDEIADEVFRRIGDANADGNES